MCPAPAVDFREGQSLHQDIGGGIVGVDDHPPGNLVPGCLARTGIEYERIVKNIFLCHRMECIKWYAILLQGIKQAGEYRNLDGAGRDHPLIRENCHLTGRSIQCPEDQLHLPRKCSCHVIQFL